jgi:acetyltransferase-like isoleucine patch superfamily enzyme
MAFLTNEQLQSLGFKHVGKKVLISDKASIYNAAKISVGDYSRIDDFCILSAGTHGIEIGRNVHIACYVSLIGNGKITVSDFGNISSRCAIYSNNDDYSGNFMTNPTLPAKYLNVQHADVHIGKHVIVGSSSVILPGVTIGDGAAIGAFTLVNKNCDPLGIYVGQPAKYLKPRAAKIFELEKQFLEEEAQAAKNNASDVF